MNWSLRACLLLSVSVSLSLCLDHEAEVAAGSNEDGARVRQKRFIHWSSDPRGGSAGEDEDEEGWGAVEGVPRGGEEEEQEEEELAGKMK